jgi:hypothetical protein
MHLRATPLFNAARATTLRILSTTRVSKVSGRFRGKVVDLEEYSHCHRTTLGHFLAHGKWEETVPQHKVKTEFVRNFNETGYRY